MQDFNGWNFFSIVLQECNVKTCVGKSQSERQAYEEIISGWWKQSRARQDHSSFSVLHNVANVVNKGFGRGVKTIQQKSYLQRVLNLGPQD